MSEQQISPCGALTPNKIYKKKMWVSNYYSSYDSVSAMLSNLGWRSLEYRLYDSRLAMLNKIQYDFIIVPMPSYFERPIRITRHMHPLNFRQVQVSADYYRHSFFPMTVVLWNRVPADLVVLGDLDSFKREVSKKLFRAIGSTICFNPVFITSY